jgi:hypothetical protein
VIESGQIRLFNANSALFLKLRDEIVNYEWTIEPGEILGYVYKPGGLLVLRKSKC